jgi:hypothetical protein
MFVCCECCVLSGRGLCDELITRPEESYRLWHVAVCDKETSKSRRLKPATGLWKIKPQWVVTPGKQTNIKVNINVFKTGDLCFSIYNFFTSTTFSLQNMVISFCVCFLWQKAMINTFKLNLETASTTEWFNNIGQQLTRATKLHTVGPDTWGSVVSFLVFSILR